MFVFKNSGIAVAFLMVAAAIYAVFICNWIPYNDTVVKEVPCYSANREYYILRYTTPWDVLAGDFSEKFGEVRLFHKSGKLISKGEALITPIAGPHWLGGDPSVAGSDLVFFMNGVGNGDGWSAPSPTFFGSFPLFENCASTEKTSPGT